MKRMAVKLGFIGVGGISRSHLRDIQAMPEEAEIVGMVDVSREQAEKMTAEFGGRVFDSADALAREVDGLYICLPPFAHGEAERAAINARKPFFVEKPVALTMETAREIEREAARAGVIAAVGYHWRYAMPIARAREVLEGATIGMVLGYWMGGGPQPGTTFRPGYWWGVKEKSGGQIVEQTTHIVDSARYLAGEVATVHANLAQRALGNVEGFNAPDVGTVNLKFESGAVGIIVNACMLPRGGQVMLQVIAQGGERLMTESSLNSLKVTRPDSITEYPVGPDGFSRAFASEDAAFVHAVATGNPSELRSTYSDAVKTLAVSLAANESAETGDPIRLDRWH
jgi:myo-inositol 2-dehydrogenase / D-chiro-inositol 1-dehydrogenase